MASKSSSSIKVDYRGKRTTFTRRAGKLYVGGKPATKHQRRLASSLFRQQAKGLTPSIQAARGHAGERGTDAQARKAFYAQYGAFLMSQQDIDANATLQQGTFIIGKRTVKQSWGHPWRTANPRVRYDFYAIVHVRPLLGKDGKVGSPDEFDFDVDGDFDAERARAKDPMDVVMPVWPENRDPDFHGALMQEVIDGFEQNVATMLQRLGYEPADTVTQEPVTDPLDVGRYLIGLFRHRYDPKDRKERTIHAR